MAALVGLAVLDAAGSENHCQHDPDCADATRATAAPKGVDRLSQCERASCQGPAPSDDGAGSGVSSISSGKWQATNWPGRSSRICGSSSAQRSAARGQRVRNRPPDGGLSGEGTSPPTPGSSSGLVSGSGTGIAESKAAVYGCLGDRNRSSGEPISHSLPRYITATRSLTFFTTARSCAMKTIVRP